MSDFYLGLLRHALTALGTILATKGIIDGGMVEPVAGALVTIGSVGWMALNKWTSKAPAQ